MSPASKKTSMKKTVPLRKPIKREAVFQVPKPPMRMYRTIAAVAVVLVATILGVVLYVSAVKATIHVKSSTEPVQSEFVIDVVKVPTRESEIRGRVLQTGAGKQKTFKPDTQGLQEIPGVARGTVTLKNSSKSPQQLVATTRLHAPDGKQFRIDKSVIVPALGSIDVPAHADFEGKEGDVAPTTFIIPGLTADRQKVVTGENKVAFTGGLTQKAVITQQDIDKAAVVMRDELSEQISGLLREEAGNNFAGEQYIVDVVSQSSSVNAGAEAGQFDLTMSVKVTGVFYDKKALEDVAVRQLYERLTQGSEFVDINKAGIKTTIDRYDVAGEIANLRVVIDGRSITSTTSAALDPSRFVGKSEQQVRDLLVAEGVAQDVTIDFYPSFIKTVPRLKDHVIVKIE